MTMKYGFEILWSMVKVSIPGLIILGIIELVIAYITRAKEKDGKYGAFIGCSNYPNCKFTKKL